MGGIADKLINLAEVCMREAGYHGSNFVVMHLLVFNDASGICQISEPVEIQALVAIHT
jgi:hypothetical protein